MGKAGSEEGINYLQRVHDLSRFPLSISSEQLHCSAQVGFQAGSRLQLVDYFCGTFRRGFFR